jgi:hypothetical protein
VDRPIFERGPSETLNKTPDKTPDCAPVSDGGTWCTLLHMMRVLTIAIPDDVNDELREIAVREFRRPRDQASVLPIAAIRRAAAQRAREGITPIEARSAEPDDRPRAA